MKLRLATALLVGALSTGIGLLEAVEDKQEQASETAPNTLTPQEQKDGWKLLFDGKTLDGWRIFKKQDTTGWTVKDNAISLEKTGSGDLLTKEKYGAFELLIDWKIETGSNSGVLYRVSEAGGQTWTHGPEMQILKQKPTDALDKHGCGALYDLYVPSVNALKPSDQWNTFKVVANGKHIEHWVNGQKVVECEIGSDDWNQRIAKSKFKKSKEFASQASGHIALQDHGSTLAFRNVKIKVLAEK